MRCVRSSTPVLAGVEVAQEAVTRVGTPVVEDVGMVTDIRANVLGSTEESFTSPPPEQVTDAAAELVVELAALVPSVTAIGVGIGGLVRDYTCVVSAPLLPLEDVALGPLLSRRTGLQTVVGNDVVALTEA